MIAGRTISLAAVVLSLALAGSAAAHGGSHAAAPAAGTGTGIALRDCYVSAVFVPRPPAALQLVFRTPLDLDQTFYGPDPLLGVWGIECERARVAGRRAGGLIASIVGVPVGLTSAGATPLANNFDHALLRIDTSSAVLATALRRAGIPGGLARGARYRHSRPGDVPSRGRLAIPGQYAIAVSASAFDPTNPHDHVNRFVHRGRGSQTTLSLSAQDAIDRFCLLPSEACSASISAPRGSSVARMLGGRSAPVLAGFDHERLPRIDLVLAGPAR